MEEGDVMAECDECGKVVRESEYQASPSLLDDWMDCGDEAYCPRCKTAPAPGKEAAVEG